MKIYRQSVFFLFMESTETSMDCIRKFVGDHPNILVTDVSICGFIQIPGTSTKKMCVQIHAWEEIVVEKIRSLTEEEREMKEPVEVLSIDDLKQRERLADYYARKAGRGSSSVHVEMVAGSKFRWFFGGMMVATIVLMMMRITFR